MNVLKLIQFLDTYAARQKIKTCSLPGKKMFHANHPFGCAIYVKIYFDSQESSKLTSGVLHDTQPNF